MVEFTREQRKLYEEQYGSKLDKELSKKKKPNPYAKSIDKNAKGDI